MGQAHAPSANTGSPFSSLLSKMCLFAKQSATYKRQPHPRRSTFRDFVPWPVADAGCWRVWKRRCGRRPQPCTPADSRSAANIGTGANHRSLTTITVIGFRRSRTRDQVMLPQWPILAGTLAFLAGTLLSIAPIRAFEHVEPGSCVPPPAEQHTPEMFRSGLVNAQ